MSISKQDGELELEQIAKRLLAMPHKLRGESKIGKRSAKGKKSPKAKQKPDR